MLGPLEVEQGTAAPRRGDSKDSPFVFGYLVGCAVEVIAKG